jgi:hypothetical protein
MGAFLACGATDHTRALASVNGLERGVMTRGVVFASDAMASATSIRHATPLPHGKETMLR